MAAPARWARSAAPTAASTRCASSAAAQSYVPPHLSKDQDIELQPGDRIYVSTPGGGGFGDPFKRDPQRVAQDVARGYYTAAQAESLFGVRLAADGSVDAKRTEELRKARLIADTGGISSCVLRLARPAARPRGSPIAHGR